MFGATRRKLLICLGSISLVTALWQLTRLSNLAQAQAAKLRSNAWLSNHLLSQRVPPRASLPVLTAPGVVPHDATRAKDRTSSPTAPATPITVVHNTGILKTEVLRHAPGWTRFKNLYMAGGTLYIVTDDRSSFPPVIMMMSKGYPAVNTPENIKSREPSAEDMDFLTLAAARRRWATRILDVEGVTFLVNEPWQFINHYYHFVAELLFGTWRFYAAEDPNIGPLGETSLPNPSRFIFAHCNEHAWRDYSGMNQYFIHSAFPSVGVETLIDWEGRINMTAPGDKQRVWRFNDVLLADRSSAFRGEICGLKTQRIAAEAFEATRSISSKYWWEPVRRRVLRFAGVPQSVLNIGMDPLPTGNKVVITYISRQASRRRLLESDHKALVEALLAVCEQKGWKLNVVFAEQLTRDEQLQVAARTTIMLGVHGNGLTHMVAMAPTPISTVIEILYPGGFAHDYQWTATALGMKHIGVWNDTWFTLPNEPGVGYPDGFQGTSIPVDAGTVIEIITDRVEGRLPT